MSMYIVSPINTSNHFAYVTHLSETRTFLSLLCSSASSLHLLARFFRHGKPTSSHLQQTQCFLDRYKIFPCPCLVSSSELAPQLSQSGQDQVPHKIGQAAAHDHALFGCKCENGRRYKRPVTVAQAHRSEVGGSRTGGAVQIPRSRE